MGVYEVADAAELSGNDEGQIETGDVDHLLADRVDLIATT